MKQRLRTAFIRLILKKVETMKNGGQEDRYFRLTRFKSFLYHLLHKFGQLTSVINLTVIRWT